MLKEIGRGDRVALAKLAVEHLEQTQRPLRIAIDAAIWNFQTQAGQGGKNPALRTLYYRLLRLLALPIHPLFVYDGKNKPLTKRGQTVARYGTCINNETSKKLLQQFRFPCHTAPGEAEAECAQLQKSGIVDMVMSQDGDAMMFGSRLTLRNWSKEGARGNSEPTHVDVLDLEKIKTGPGLDPDGMILVALLSGGDYNQQGLPGFGVHVACDIARAGFGTDLLEAVRNNDQEAIRDWRERLTYELETNESGYFKKRHKTLKIPEDFPDRQILRYYTAPAVSSEEILARLEQTWAKEWNAEIDIPALRQYVGQTFDWQYKGGAWKLVRTLSRPLLANRLQKGYAGRLLTSVDHISERREHYTTGGIPEIRIAAVPADIVGLDLEVEEDNPEDLAALEEELDVGNDGEEQSNGNTVIESGLQSPTKPKKAPWNPYMLEKMWISETQVELGVPALLEEWNQIQRDKLEAARAKTKARQTRVTKSKSVLVKQSDRIDQYFAASRVENTTTTLKPHNDRAIQLHLQEQGKTAISELPRTPAKRRSKLKTGAISDRSPDLKQYFRPAKEGSRSVLPRKGVAGEADVESSKHFQSTTSHFRSKDDLDLPALNISSVTGSFDNPIALTSSPAQPSTPATEVLSSLLTPDMGDVGTHASQTPSPLRKLEESVTRRKPRREPRKFTRSKTEGEAPSEDLGPIEQLLSPTVGLGPEPATTASLLMARARSSKISLDLGTGLKAGFGRRKIFALPRESLEGTWKEMDSDEEVVALTSTGRSRVSYVNLEAD